MANENQFVANSATAAELNARCRDVIIDHGASYAGERERKRCQMKKQHEEEADGIKAAIPADILGDVLKRMNPEEAIRLSSVCRYWRAPALACDPTRRSTPWKITLTQSDDQLHFLLQSVANASIILNIRSVRVCHGAVTCLGSWHGWLALRLLSLRDHLFLLLNPFSGVRLSLPHRDSLRDVICLTSDPEAPGCTVIAQDLKSNFLIWRPGDTSWTVEAVEGGLCPSCPAVWFKEQLLVLDWNPFRMRLLSLRLNPPRCEDLQVKFCSDMLDHREGRSFQLCVSKYLVESQGNVLAFVVVDSWAYGHINRRLVRVFRLDWDAMSFVWVESGGIDRALFLVGGGQSFSVSTGEAGCTAGCVYLAQNYDCFPEPGSNFSCHCYCLRDVGVTSVQNQYMTTRSCRSVGKFWITPNMQRRSIHHLQSSSS